MLLLLHIINQGDSRYYLGQLRLNHNFCIAFVSLLRYNTLKGGIVMPKTANINLRIEPDIKAQADAVFSSLGISVTDAINVFLHASIMEGGFPFQPKQPRYNRETVMAMQEARDIMAGKVKVKRYSSLNDILADIDAEDTHA